MVEPVSNSTIPSLVAGKVASVENRQIVERTIQDRGVSYSKKEDDTKKDKEREDRRLAALGELHEEVMKHAGVSDGHLRISEDEISGRTVYQTVDDASGKVIKQYPAEEILRSARVLRVLQGMLVDRRA